MPRLQVYLPDDLHAEVKAHGLPASQLLQAAIRTELRRRRALDALDEHLEVRRAEIGEPTAADRRWAQELVDRIDRRTGSRAG